MKIHFTIKAKDKLAGIHQYYQDKSQGKVGRQIRAKIIDKIMSLRNFPLLGPADEKLEHLESAHRYLVSENYKIIYRIDGHDVIILNIFDTRQDPEKMKE